MRSLGLYIHIPFCKAKCIYCDFYSLPRAEGQMDAYVSALTAQLAAWRERTADCTVDTVYFGGGTPSYLGPDRLCRLLDAVFQSYRVAPGAEITLEANPDSAQDISALRQLHDAGFDRLSLGMQSADDAELRRIGRVHTHAQTVRAVENARAAGFDNLSLDLIYGLPGQTMTRWQANLDAALALAEYLGFGPGAHSDFGGERFALARDLDAYLAGHIVYSECSAPSARERETERVMLALRTTRGVAADTLPEAARRILRNCEAHGLAHLSGGFYALTPRGFLVSNAILVDLLETMEL